MAVVRMRYLVIKSYLVPSHQNRQLGPDGARIMVRRADYMVYLYILYYLHAYLLTYLHKHILPLPLSLSLSPSLSLSLSHTHTHT